MGVTPSEAEIMRRALDRHTEGLWSALPGVVQAYDAGSRTADVLPVIRQPLGGWDDTALVHEQLPVLPSVPVVFPAGGGCSVVWKLAPGDHVLVVFSTLSPAAWRRSGAVSDAGTARRSSLGYGFAVPGVGPRVEGLPDPGGLLLDGPDVLIGEGAARPIARGDAVAAWLEALKAAITALGGTITPPVDFPTTGDVATSKGKVG